MKLLNERTPMLLGLSVIVGVLVASTHFWLWIPVLCFAILYAILRKKMIYFGAIVLFVALGFSSFLLQKSFFLAEPIEGYLTLEGTVLDVGAYAIVRTNVGNFAFWTNELLSVGDRVSITGAFTPVENNFFYYFSEGIKSIGKVDEISVLGISFDPFLLAKRGIKEGLFSSMDESSASTAYALLTGSTGYIDGTSLTNIRYGGIAHIFAVSGLHIGVLYFALNWIIPIERRFRPFVSLPIVFFYACVCGLTTSALRAFIICLASGINSFLGRKSDALVNLGYAIILIVLLRPMEVFLVGFQLSVLACVGMDVFAKYLKIPTFSEKLTMIASGTLAVQILTLPILLDTFGYVSGIGILLNMVLIPLLAPLMGFLFVGLPLSIISPIFLYPAKGIIRLFLWLVSVTDFEPFVIRGRFGIAGIFYYLSLLFLSDLFQMKKQIKYTVSALMMLLCILTIGMGWNL